MSKPDGSWLSKPLPGNEDVAAKTRDLVAAAERALQKQPKLEAAIKKHTGHGADPENIARAVVDHDGKPLSIVIDEKAFHHKPKHEVEAACVKAFAAAVVDVRAQHARTEEVFKDALDLNGLPTVDEIYTQLKHDQEKGSTR